ncbi:MAG TPA: outer membrane beta-barrel protein [Bacteroidales bacterium]|nr:outer membrane beta-barrel protein [Bacteroidales bacterium]
MRTLILFAAILLSGTLLPAQETAADSSTVTPAKEKSNALIFILDLHHDLWMDVPEEIEQDGFFRSALGINIGLMYGIPLGTSMFSVAIGPTVGTHAFSSNGQLLQDADENSFFQKIEKDIAGNDISYKRNRLTLTYLDLPVEVRMKTRSDIRAAVGFKAGYLVGSETFYNGDSFLNAEKQLKVRYYALENIEKLRYGALLRLGYKWFNLYGYYSLSRVFEDGKGPELYPVSVGISLVPF